MKYTKAILALTILLIACEKENEFVPEKPFDMVFGLEKNLNWNNFRNSMLGDTIDFYDFNGMVIKEDSNLYSLNDNSPVGHTIVHQYFTKYNLVNSIWVYYSYSKTNEIETWNPDFIEFYFKNESQDSYNSVKETFSKSFGGSSDKFKYKNYFVTIEFKNNKLKAYYCKDNRNTF